jgi:hypothetical protein
MARKTQPPLTPEQRQRQLEGARRWQASRTPEEKRAFEEKMRQTYHKARAARRLKTGVKLPGRLSSALYTAYDIEDLDS